MFVKCLMIQKFEYLENSWLDKFAQDVQTKASMESYWKTSFLRDYFLLECLLGVVAECEELRLISNLQGFL